uniref:PH domain-containing protein n=1 Tax=Aureoumbra lagunensis TaxID=44058 RepID=A0A7S3K1I5_9STRA
MNLGSVVLRKDGVLIVFEVGGAYAHYLRACEQLHDEKMPSIDEWQTALLRVLATRPLGEQYCSLGTARSENGAPLRISGPLLKKGGSRGSFFTKTRRPSLSGGRRNWNEREFFLDFERACFEYREKGDEEPRGIVRLRPGSIVQAPDEIRLRGRHAEPLRDGTDEDPLYFELKNTLDSENRPRDVFAMRALKRRDFDEWILALNACIDKLKQKPDDLSDSARQSLAQCTSLEKVSDQEDKRPTFTSAIPRLPFFTRASPDNTINDTQDSSDSSSASSFDRDTSAEYPSISNDQQEANPIDVVMACAAAEASINQDVHDVSYNYEPTCSNEKSIDVGARIRALTLASNTPSANKNETNMNNTADKKINMQFPPPPPPKPTTPKISPTVTPSTISKNDESPSFKKPPPPAKKKPQPPPPKLKPQDPPVPSFHSSSCTTTNDNSQIHYQSQQPVPSCKTKPPPPPLPKKNNMPSANKPTPPILVSARPEAPTFED